MVDDDRTWRCIREKNDFILIKFQTIKDHPSVFIRDTIFNAALH